MPSNSELLLEKFDIICARIQFNPSWHEYWSDVVLFLDFPTEAPMTRRRHLKYCSGDDVLVSTAPPESTTAVQTYEALRRYLRPLLIRYHCEL